MAAKIGVYDLTRQNLGLVIAYDMDAILHQTNKSSAAFQVFHESSGLTATGDGTGVGVEDD